MTERTFFSARVFQVISAAVNPVYTIGFPYLQPQDIYVYVGIEEVVPETEDPPPPPETVIVWTLVPYGPGVADRWEFEDDGLSVKLNFTVQPGRHITIRRYTKRDTRMADYVNGSVLTEFDLNVVTRQLLYLIQEIMDIMSIGQLGTGSVGGGNGPGDGGGPGGGGTGPVDINGIITAILNTQLFRDLISLIDLMDINAETLISTLLNDHNNWALSQNLDVGFTNLQTETENGLLEVNAMITRLDDDVQAFIIEVNETFADEREARASAITSLGTQFGNNLSNAIQGVQSVSNAQGSQITGIASFVAGSGYTFNPDGTIVPGGTGGLNQALSTVQTLQTAQAGELSTLASFRTGLGSVFNVTDPLNADFGNRLASAIRTEYRTYADSGSTTATRVASLESNTRPIFFGSLSDLVGPPPNPANINPYSTDPNGFPNGALWYRNLGFFRRAFFWHRGQANEPPGLLTGLVDGVDYWFIPGRPGFSNQSGWWYPNFDGNVQLAYGARIDNLEQTRVTATGAEAIAQNTVAVAFGGVSGSAGFAAVQQRMQSLFRAPTDGTPGLIYSTYNVRINAQLGNNRPVMAGFGLGLQGDPNNPDSLLSDFIVMANRFSVINPPTSGTPVNGTLDVNKIVVPFIIDANTSSVIVNGTLIARSLSAATAGVGRLIVGAIDPATGLLVNPESGRRLTLPSAGPDGTWNLSNTTSPFTGGQHRFLLWAGDGTMNANNATFYVDTDGNAEFKGQVLADNLVGTVNDSEAILQSFGAVTAPSGVNSITRWFDEYITTLSPTARARRVVASVSITLFGTGVPTARGALQMSVDGGSWETVAESPIAIPTGSTLTLTGGIATPTNKQVRLRVGIGPGPGTGGGGTQPGPQCNYFAGIIQGIR